MKKILITSLLAACAAMSLSSCSKAYDANPDGVASGTNPLNPPKTGGGGGGGSNFNWSGTDPMSVKIDGTAYQATTGVFGSTTVGTYSFDYIAGVSGTDQFMVGFPVDAAAGTYTFNNSGTAASFTTVEGGSPTVYASSLGGSGSVQIIENDATHVKGKFFGVGKNAAGTSKDFTEGYFNVTK
jgi:hypothetical protein